jgi:hypothetical protein
MAAMVKDHRKEIRRLEQRVDALQVDYISLLKEMAAAFAEDDDD